MATDLRPTDRATLPAPVRRSALESVHRHLAGSATTDARRWPVSYGDPDGERLAVTESIGLGEPGLFDKLLVRGSGALTEARAAGLRAEPGRLTPADDVAGVNVWAIAEDELLLLVLDPAPGSSIRRTASVPQLASSLAAGHVAVTDVSSAWTVLRLVGPQVRSLLEELVVSDISADAIADLQIIQVTMAQCRVLMARRDLDAVPGFTLLVVRDEAEHLWDVLVERGAAYGLRPVCGLALRPDASVVREATPADTTSDDASSDQVSRDHATRGAAPIDGTLRDDAARLEAAFGTNASEPSSPNRLFRPRPQRPRPGTQDGDR